MSIAHDKITGGHLGIRKTREKITSNCYWRGIDGDVVRYCHSCDVRNTQYKFISARYLTHTLRTPYPHLLQGIETGTPHTHTYIRRHSLTVSCVL